MAYAYFPARQTNFFPPGPPYLAGLRGLRGMRGLGDYAADLAAYNAAMIQWRLDSLRYRQALAIYNAKVKNIDTAYDAALAAYNADKAKWDKEYTVYLVATKSWQAAYDSYKAANTVASMKVAAAFGLNLNMAYYSAGACLTQAEHDAAARQCVTVKGLGSTSEQCGLTHLPVCQLGPRPTIRAKPVAPTKPAYPAKPAALRPAPVAPTAPAAPSSGGGGGSPTTHPDSPSLPSPAPVPGPDASPTPAADDSKQANVLMGGLIVAALVGGGYLVYRTLKKPKAQAA